MKRILVMLLFGPLCIFCLWAESFTYDFADLGDQKEVPVTKIETDVFTLEFDKGTSETQPIYYKNYAHAVFLQPGNTMKVIAKNTAQIAKIIFHYNIPSSSLIPDYGTYTAAIWEIPAGHSTVLFTAFENPQSTEIKIYGIELVFYEQPTIPYCNSSKIKNGDFVKIYSPGAESLRIIKPDGSFEDIACNETYPTNYANYSIKFPLQAEQTSIDVYPIQRNWHYSNLKTTITFTQIFDEHTSDDIKVGNIYYNVATDSDGQLYAQVRSDDRYRDLTEVNIPDYIRTADGIDVKVKSIGGFAFSNCEYLKKIVLPSTLNEICNGAFWGCKSLENIDIPESVTIIGSRAFAYCENLKMIKFPDNLKAFAFYSEGSPIKGCKRLTKAVLPNNAPESGINWHHETSSFLEGCNSVQEIIIPDKVTGLSDDFFTGNESVKTIKFGTDFSQFPSSIIDLPNLKELVIDPANNNFKEVDGALYCRIKNGDDAWLLVWLREVAEDGVLRLIDTSTGIQNGALEGYTLQEVIYPTTLTSTGWDEQLKGCRVEKLVIPGTMEKLGTAAFRYSNIGTLIIEEGDSPIIMDAYDSTRENDGVFHNSKIENLIINRDIDNVNNYGWPKPHTKAFYRCSIRTVTINTSLGKNACGILSDASVSTIKIGPDVMSMYALGNYQCSNVEIYSTSDINAPFNVDDGPLNTLKYTFNGLKASNIYVYPTQLDKYKAIYPYKNVLPLPGTSSIQFNNLTKTLKPTDTYTIDYTTLPGDLNLEWTSSNAKAATVSENGEVSALADGATIITAQCIDKGYEHLSESMTIYVSENAEIESEEAYLTIKGLGNHSSRHCYKTGSVAVIEIIPEEGWSIHTITLNGEDISDAIVNNTILTPELYGENEINIVFQTDVYTGKTQIKNSNVEIKYGQNSITVEGIAQDSLILVYDLSGRCIYQGTNHTISLESNKYYILKAENTLFKFTL